MAEVLITLGIIGVVAAMTLPPLIQKYKEHVITTQLKKSYTTLSQVMLRAFPDYDFADGEFVDANTKSLESWFITYLKPYIKILKYCVNSSGCWNDKTYTLNGNSSGNDGVGLGGNIIIFNMADGYNVNLDVWSSLSYINNNFGISSKEAAIAFWVDLNGARKPNVIGKDIFVFLFTKERGMLPAGHDMSDAQISSNCSKNGNGFWCSEKIIRNGWKIDKANIY